MSIPYYRFFPGDYDRDTRHVSMMQHGAYRLLIDEYMVHGPLPNDLQRMYRICGAFNAEERAAVEFILAEFFELSGPYWKHKRCDEERLWQESRHAAGVKASAARWGSDRNANALPSQCDRPCVSDAYQNQNQKGSSPTAVGLLVSPPLDTAATDSQARPKRQGFVKPSREDVKGYIGAKGYKVDPDLFYDHYEANGWKVGRNGMKDWQAAVRTWAKQEKHQPQGNGGEQWWTSEAATKAKGESLGIHPRPGESWNQYRDRIRLCLTR